MEYKNNQNKPWNRMVIKAKQLRWVVLLIGALWSNSSSAQSEIYTDSILVVRELLRQQFCWNKGDIDCFMGAYWKSDSLKFVGKDGITYGWEATTARYKKKYPDKSHMGKLSFEVLEIERLGPSAIMLIGKWGLKREVGDVGGHFTLIWKKMGNEWVIVADHTS